MIRRYNLDDLRQVEQLTTSVRPTGALPRTLQYGTEPGMIPFGEAYPDKLVDPKDYKEVIEHCHRERIFPMYHARTTWRPQGFRWNQNGLPYCWAWGSTGTFMNMLARSGLFKELLSPVSLGWTVGWRSRGNYLGDTIRAIQARGITPMSYTPDQHSRNPRTFKDGWEDAAMQNRLGEVWDSDPYNIIQHAISQLSTGLSGGYVAYNWWGHALECVGVRWDESQRNNLVWVLSNSHNEDDFIELTGSRGVPDEYYTFRTPNLEQWKAA